MKKTEIKINHQKEYMSKKFGISNLRELRQATQKVKLNIGCFVTTISATAKATTK